MGTELAAMNSGLRIFWTAGGIFSGDGQPSSFPGGFEGSSLQWRGKELVFSAGKGWASVVSSKILAQQGSEDCLVIVMDIHKGFAEKRKERRISVYQKTRRSLAFLGNAV